MRRAGDALHRVALVVVRLDGEIRQLRERPSWARAAGRRQEAHGVGSVLGERSVLSRGAHQLVRIVQQWVLREKVLVSVGDELVDARAGWNVFLERRVIRGHVSVRRVLCGTEPILRAATLVGIMVWLHDFLDRELQNAAGALRLRLTHFRVVGFVIDTRGRRRWRGHCRDVEVLRVRADGVHLVAVGGLHGRAVGRLRVQRQIWCDATHLHAAGTLRRTKNNY